MRNCTRNGGQITRLPVCPRYRRVAPPPHPEPRSDEDAQSPPHPSRARSGGAVVAVAARAGRGPCRCGHRLASRQTNRPGSPGSPRAIPAISNVPPTGRIGSLMNSSCISSIFHFHSDTIIFEVYRFPKRYAFRIADQNLDPDGFGFFPGVLFKP